MKLVTLTQGRVAMVDDEDYELLMRFKWCASFGSRQSKWYAVRGIRKNERQELGLTYKISMHRFLMRPSPDMVVDHINGDSLDNRRANLEIITQAENMERSAGWKKAGHLYGSIDCL